MGSELFLLFFNVAHGHSTYAKMPNGSHWFIDLGRGTIADSNVPFSPLLHMAFNYGVTQLDHLIITHPHFDHIADIANLLLVVPRVLTAPRHLTEDDVRSGNQGKDATTVERYVTLLQNFSYPVTLATNPVNLQNNGGVHVQHFYPTRRARTNLNNHSVITVLTYAGTKVLIPGDNEAASWRELLDDPTFIQGIAGTDILLAPHHGRDAGYCADIFETFKPCLTIVSDGPGSDTSAVGKYYQHSTGWTVHSRSGGESVDRYCVTTRSDGAVTVRLRQEDDGSRLREVYVD